MTWTVQQLEAAIEQQSSAEVYILTVGDETLYLTSYFQNLVIDGQPYEAVPIKRGSLEYDSEMSNNALSIEITATSQAGKLFKADQDVVEGIFEIRKYFLDDTSDYEVPLAGFIKGASLSGGIVVLSCVSWLDVLNNDFPTKRFQSACNHKLFDTGCGLLAADWMIEATVMSIDGCKVVVQYLTAPVAYSNNYQNYDSDQALIKITAPIPGFFVDGIAVKKDTTTRRVIVAHTMELQSDTLTLHFPIKTLAVGDVLQLFPGCSKTFDKNTFPCVNHCKSFRSAESVIEHYLGATLIPYKNPTLTPMNGGE